MTSTDNDLKASAGLRAEVLDMLPHPIMLMGKQARISYVNVSGEQFFGASASRMLGAKMAQFVPFGSPLLSLIEQVRERGGSVSEYGVDLGMPGSGPRLVDIQVSRQEDAVGGAVFIMLQERTIATTMDRQMIHRGAARSVSALSAMLAHEIKNPLSGIKGAAQLLELDSPPESRDLTRLICEESDRICSIVDRMEVFSNQRPIERHPVNIHEVLDHVRRLAGAGVGANANIVEQFDPSLPPVMGERDQLIQVMLNLVKNACEAAPNEGGEVLISTAYRHGVRVQVPGTQERLALPLEVAVTDNGSGVPDEIKPHLFDPFVTTKPKGQGLGLALVAKIVGDHGGVIECESEPGRTCFRVFLPVQAGRLPMNAPLNPVMKG